MFKIIIFFVALNGQPLTDQNGNTITVTVADRHNVVAFESKTVAYTNGDCQFRVKDGALLVTRRTGKPFIQLTKNGIELPNIQ